MTGGGKTAIYVEAIVAALEAGRPALVLVPEIALALPLVDRLRAELDAEIALVHSGLGEGERADEWRRIRSGRAPIVVGTRLAVLAPLADLGLVIVDEEHDGAYKSERTPRLNAAGRGDRAWPAGRRGRRPGQCHAVGRIGRPGAGRHVPAGGAADPPERRPADRRGRRPAGRARRPATAASSRAGSRPRSTPSTRRRGSGRSS